MPWDAGDCTELKGYLGKRPKAEKRRDQGGPSDTSPTEPLVVFILPSLGNVTLSYFLLSLSLFLILLTKP